MWTWVEVRRLVPRTEPARKHWIQTCLSPLSPISLPFFAGLIRQLIVFPNFTLKFSITMIFLRIHSANTWWGYHRPRRFSSWYIFHLFPNTSILLESHMVWEGSLYLQPLVWGLAIKPMNFPEDQHWQCKLTKERLLHYFIVFILSDNLQKSAVQCVFN